MIGFVASHAKVLRRAKEIPEIYEKYADMTESEVRDFMFPSFGGADAEAREYPDFKYVDKELLKHGVNIKLLWTEYCDRCRRESKMPLMYSQFCDLYRKHREKNRASMHIPRKPGEQTEVDWAGTPSHVTDRHTGEQIPAYIFVGVLSFSQYAYAEAFVDEGMESWISAHVNMFRFMGGVTMIIVPDNLRAGVSKSDRYTPEINRTYHEMAEHYNTAIVPARVRRPQDKPAAEGTVKLVTTWITAAIRNSKFFSIAELNRAIKEKLEALNNEPFQKKSGSRSEMFFLQEKMCLNPLPAAEYELAAWKKATVQFNYHITVDHMMYSVPYEYIHKKVDIRITKNVVEVFCGDTRICSHMRLRGHKGQYSTTAEHMPKDHREYLEWNGDRFVSWAEKTGVNAAAVVKSILASAKVEQQAYRSCMGLLKLADKYGMERLEAASRRALSFTPRPTYKIVKNILVTGQDKLPKDDDMGALGDGTETDIYGFMRGAEYYGGKTDE
jgi:transposase